MADGATIPTGSNWSEWTFEQALAALTGEQTDLHTPAKATWFNFSGSPSDKDEISYHAFGDFYYGVNVDHDAVNAWAQAVSAVDAMMNDVARGKRGEMDQQTLLDLQAVITHLADWSQTTGSAFQTWANNLDSDDSSFKGKAAYLIQNRLKQNGDGLEDTHEQLTTRHGTPIATAVGDAATALSTFNQSMAAAWSAATADDIANWIENGINATNTDIYNYIVANGLQLGVPGYRLGSVTKSEEIYVVGIGWQWRERQDTDGAKAYIRRVLAAYPRGDLTVAETWTTLGNDITQSALALLKAQLDTPAQGAIGTLAPAYTKAASALIELTAPPRSTPPSLPGATGLNPDGTTGLPVPGDGGATGLNPDGTTGIPVPGDGGATGLNPDGTTGLPLPGDGGATGGGDGTGTAIPDLTLPNADGGTGTPADGGVNGLPGAIVPGAGLPGSGSANGTKSPVTIGPEGDGAFTEPGAPPANGGVKLPPVDKSTSLIPPGAGQSKTLLPDGGASLAKSPGFGIGDGTGGGFGKDIGMGGVGAGAGLGASAGAGGGIGAGGGPGGSGFTTAPSQLTGGNPGVSGSAGVAGAPGVGSSGSGGVPFYPPMMGGGAGAGAGMGESPKERQRQTWLSEDEEVWGTRVDAGSGVIGRLDEEDYDAEEALVPVEPFRGRRNTGAPRRPRPAEEETTAPGASGVTTAS